MTLSESRLVTLFGENLFGVEQMRALLPRDQFERLETAIREARPISAETADAVAHAMKIWAISKGATHFTHWFQPLTGLTAEKHDSFLALDASARPISRFSGRQLIVSEPDASSFPHGGLRSTFEARGYAAWDPSSPAFIVDRGGQGTLCLPSIFVSYKGEVLDKKTPLIRSVQAVSKSSLRMLRLLGNKRATHVSPTVGAEQEYFLVDRELFEKRPDLRQVGATLLGAPPSRGQHFEDHYFGTIPDRVLDFMEEAENELVRLGVLVKTRHNEVAPAQYEFAVLHQPVNIAADQNQLVMDVMRRVAPRHGLAVLFHEKPYAKINGSGKHNNWSLIDSEGTNLYEPGTTSAAQLRFLVFLMATVWGVERHNALLQAISASAGNDLRLGGNEAPPRITSAYLGEHITQVLESILHTDPKKLSEQEDIDLGIGGVAKVPRDTTDRNRTSPFAFTGNKLEFRAVGAHAAISLPNVVLNLITAESLDKMSDRIESYLASGASREGAVLSVLREVVAETSRCRFDGDCYTEEWAKEAERRGLKAPSNAPEALRELIAEPSVNLFERYGILTRSEVEARYRVRLDQYAKTVAMELRVVRSMLRSHVLPAAVRFERRLAEAISLTAASISPSSPGLAEQRAHLERLSRLIGELVDWIGRLERHDELLASAASLPELADLCAQRVRPDIFAVRKVADEVEGLVDATEWHLPSYDEMLAIR